MGFYDNSTPEQVKEEIFAEYEGNLDTRPGSFMDLTVSPIALEIWKNRMDREGLMSMVFPDETSGTYIDKNAAIYGITRKAGTYAEAEISFTGADGTVIPEGTAFLTADGREYRLTEAVTIRGGTGSGTVRAADVGYVYNTGAGEIDEIYYSIPGVTGYTAGAAEGGTDPESNAELLERYLTWCRHPSSSGNRWDYYNWAMSVEGVGKAEVKPLWDGPGTVKVLLASPSGGKVEPEVVEAARAYIETQRPIGATVTVESVSERTIPVTAAVKLAAGGSVQTVKADFTAALAEYFAGISLGGGTVSYNKVAYLLLNVEGVEDFVTLTVDGDTRSIELPDGAGAVPGEITITEAGA